MASNFISPFKTNTLAMTIGPGGACFDFESFDNPIKDSDLINESMEDQNAEEY